MAGTARDVASHGHGDISVLQHQRIGGSVGVDRPVALRIGREGDHQLHRLMTGRGPRALGSARTAGHLAGHHRRPRCITTSVTGLLDQGAGKLKGAACQRAKVTKARNASSEGP